MKCRTNFVRDENAPSPDGAKDPQAPPSPCAWARLAVGSLPRHVFAPGSCRIAAKIKLSGRRRRRSRPLPPPIEPAGDDLRKSS